MSATIVDWIFFGPARLVAWLPYAGIALGLLLIALQALSTWRGGGAWGATFFKKAPVLAGFLWVIFELYERQMAAIGDQAGALRMDLLVLTPILYVLTAVAVLSLLGSKPKRG